MSQVTLTKIAAPATPAANQSTMFVDTVDRRRKEIDETGAQNVLTPRQIQHNLIINGGFDFAQRQVPGTLTPYTITADRVASADRWKLSIQTSSLQFAQIDTIAAVEAGLLARYYGQFKQITGAGKFMLTQAVEGVNSFPLRSRVVRFSCKMKYSVAVAMTVRLGLIVNQSGGTVDAPTNPFTTAWGANSTDPTLGANLAYVAPTLVEVGTLVGNAMSCVLTTAWVRYSATFLVPAGTKNVMPAIWSDGQLAINDQFLISECELHDGQEIFDWSPRIEAEEFSLCQRYYAKTFPLAIAPVQSGGVTGAIRFAAGKAGALAEIAQWIFPVQMRTTPGIITLYNPSAANAQVRDVTAAADCSASAAASATDRALDINATGNASTVVGNELKVHLTVDAEF